MECFSINTKPSSWVDPSQWKRLQCPRDKYSFLPAQSQNCLSRLTFTYPPSVLERKSCYHDFCSWDTCLVLCFYTVLYSASLVMFSTCKHIFCLFLLASCLSMSVNVHVCARICAFPIYLRMWLYVCISLVIVSFWLHWKAVNIPISSGTYKQLWLQPCKFGDNSWRIHFWSQLLWEACLS